MHWVYYVCCLKRNISFSFVLIFWNVWNRFHVVHYLCPYESILERADGDIQKKRGKGMQKSKKKRWWMGGRGEFAVRIAFFHNRWEVVSSGAICESGFVCMRSVVFTPNCFVLKEEGTK